MADWWLAVQLLALAGFSLLAFTMRILDALGSAMSFVLGLAIVLSGGLAMLLLMALFTGLAFLATRTGRARKLRLGLLDGADGERRAANVIGNGAAPALAALTVFVDAEAARLAFAAAVAAIAADTMGSEIGVLSDRARGFLPPFPPAQPGENGAVSLLGQVSALVGAAAVAVAAVPLLGLGWGQAWIPLVAGFAGGQLDSLLGATLERDYIRNDRPLRKQDVNFLASFVPALIVFLAFAIG